MKRAGIEDRTLITLTGHKKIDNLKHCDLAPDNSKMLEMSMAIFAKKKSKLVPVAKLSSTITSGQMQLVTETPNIVQTEVHDENDLVTAGSPNRE